MSSLTGINVLHLALHTFSLWFYLDGNQLHLFDSIACCISKEKLLTAPWNPVLSPIKDRHILKHSLSKPRFEQLWKMTGSGKKTRKGIKQYQLQFSGFVLWLENVCGIRSAETLNPYTFWQKIIFRNGFIDDCERVGIITIRRVIQVGARWGKLLEQDHVKWKAILREVSLLQCSLNRELVSQSFRHPVT